MGKPIDAESADDLVREEDDVQFVGNQNLWKVLVKAWSDEDEWCDTTMAMKVPGGVMIRTTYQSEDLCSESSVYIPGANIEKDSEGNYILV